MATTDLGILSNVQSNTAIPFQARKGRNGARRKNHKSSTERRTNENKHRKLGYYKCESCDQRWDSFKMLVKKSGDTHKTLMRMACPICRKQCLPYKTAPLEQGIDSSHQEVQSEDGSVFDHWGDIDALVDDSTKANDKNHSKHCRGDEDVSHLKHQLRQSVTKKHLADPSEDNQIGTAQSAGSGTAQSEDGQVETNELKGVGEGTSQSESNKLTNQSEDSESEGDWCYDLWHDDQSWYGSSSCHSSSDDDDLELSDDDDFD